MNKERLLILAAHLRGPLAQNNWDFTKLHIETSCGSTGCALGECPYVFPEDWEFELAENTSYPNARVLDPRLIGTKDSAFTSAEAFFGIHAWECGELFSPFSPRPEQDEDFCDDESFEETLLDWEIDTISEWNKDSSLRLLADSTPLDVALSIENFVNWKEGQNAENT